ncbi:hypothetical protein GCM10023086_67750 [Streptomyces venetus]|uniref:Uncharacterized protein n=1 Tax=Streptomyces venetus TaxID=1701086 RepID=A0ABP8H744_9ACTN
MWGRGVSVSATGTGKRLASIRVADELGVRLVLFVVSRAHPCERPVHPVAVTATPVKAAIRSERSRRLHPPNALSTCWRPYP